MLAAEAQRQSDQAGAKARGNDRSFGLSTSRATARNGAGVFGGDNGSKRGNADLAVVSNPLRNALDSASGL